MAIDKENLAAHIEHLKEYLSQLMFLKSKYSKEDFLKKWQVEDQISRKLQISIECILDIGDLIINGLDIKKPETYADIPEILGEKGIITKNLSDDLIRLAKFRNVIVHDYLYLDKDKVFYQFESLPNKIEKFIEAIKIFVKKL